MFNYTNYTNFLIALQQNKPYSAGNGYPKGQGVTSESEKQNMPVYTYLKHYLKIKFP